MLPPLTNYDLRTARAPTFLSLVLALREFPGSFTEEPYRMLNHADRLCSFCSVTWVCLHMCAHVCSELRFYSQVNVGTLWNKMQTFNIRQTSRDICIIVLTTGCTRFP